MFYDDFKAQNQFAPNFSRNVQLGHLNRSICTAAFMAIMLLYTAD